MFTPPARSFTFPSPPSVEMFTHPQTPTKTPAPNTQPLKIQKFIGRKTGTHLVGLKGGVSMREVIDDLFKAVKEDDAKIGAKWESINAFSGTFGPESLKFLCGCSRVSYIEESGYVSTPASPRLQCSFQFQTLAHPQERD
ncbi:uncharacterized protein LACBIDRAFT_334193 [Laccaria bicolor S238N-H82]|uniref:Predicted protein n=1 Tax=Laccaria bicolor (strain S238N-H82 / ATCC MYA-4686) TaxID=486041 RepID=B0DYE2_LACBS|nr:uncharacterized protein LACBIDRAFT_334193 [Laccaria bicolor S238N-H82]EDR00373.1 predicted protein [Laccaria bicolor S238N-H82]|eukprot:XP_001888932.1 predicted protein [Laccaria bicolor S238N-H82]